MSQTETVPDPVVIRYPTVMDGAVLRWYWSIEEAADGLEMCSASRNGVYEKDDVCPLEWLNDAHEVGALLRREGNAADTSRWETHTTSLFGPITVIAKAEIDERFKQEMDSIQEAERKAWQSNPRLGRTSDQTGGD